MNINQQRALFFLGGAIVGSAISYFVLEKTMGEKYETLLDLETAKMRDHYEVRLNEQLKDRVARKAKAQAKPHKEKTARQEDLERLKDTLKGQHYLSPEDEDEMESKLQAQEDAPGVIVNDGHEKNVFDENKAKDIDPNRPYVISIVAYNEEHTEYEKKTITWYSDDEILADEREEIIPDPDYTIGEDALTRFGDMSGDKNVVYVRNDNISVDFEVVLDEGSYAKIILGIEPEKKHRVRKMRDGD